MKIAIIGSGNVGSTLASKWAEAGHRILLGVRKEHGLKYPNLLDHAGIQVMAVEEAVAAAEIVLLATPATVALEVAASLGQTKGKVIIDAMNIVNGLGRTFELSTDVCFCSYVCVFVGGRSFVFCFVFFVCVLF